VSNNLVQGVLSGAMTRNEFGEADNVESYFENYAEKIVARIVNLKIDKTEYSGSGVFILGHPVFGVLGSQWLGLDSDSYTTSRIIELKNWIDYDEDFTTTTFQNAGQSTVAGWGTGSVVFAGTEEIPSCVLQTISLGSDILLSSSKFRTGYVEKFGSDINSIVGSVSSDNGSTWTPVVSYKNKFNLNSVLGSQVVLRLVNTVGTAPVLDKLVTYFHDATVN